MRIRGKLRTKTDNRALMSRTPRVFADSMSSTGHWYTRLICSICFFNRPLASEFARSGKLFRSTPIDCDRT